MITPLVRRTGCGRMTVEKTKIGNKLPPMLLMIAGALREIPLDWRTRNMIQQAFARVGSRATVTNSKFRNAANNLPT
jgi:hypothetical protein